VTEPAVRFAGALRAAEERLRAHGLGGRRAFTALVRHLAARLDLPRELWPDGPDAPPGAELERIPLSAEVDLFGLAYERFFTDLFKGDRGQYFTPRPLVELMVDLARLRAGDRVLDPTCGSGGFLVGALARGADVDGIEVDPDLATLARLNLALCGANPRAVRAGDLFRTPAQPEYDVVLANPPFSVWVDDPEVLASSTLGAGRDRVASDVLFVEVALRWLRPGGRLVTVLPYGALSNRSLAGMRAWLEGVTVREAVVSLPEGVFLPFGGTTTRACVVALRKRPAPAKPMLAAVVRSPGFDVRRKRYRRTEPDELARLRLHLRGGAPFEGARLVDDPVWAPEDTLAHVGSDRPRVRVDELARPRRRGRRIEPDEACTLVEFADVDKDTGEVVGRRTRTGGEGFRVEPGDVLFGRMRPALRNVVRAGPPAAGLPSTLQGSGEWIPLVAEADPEFLLLALRSSFARRQLPTTAGQTRPRVEAADVLALELPDPGPAGRRALAEAVAGIHAERRRLREELLLVESLYERFGAGELDEEALLDALRRLGR